MGRPTALTEHREKNSRSENMLQPVVSREMEMAENKDEMTMH